MTLQNSHDPRRVIPLKPQQPVGGAIIDELGREVPITEGMIQRACSELEKAWESVPRQA